MTKIAKVSVIIPTYKGADSLPVALESINRQTFNDIEVIVSDDNGKNTVDQKKTEEVIQKFSNVLKISYLINNHVNGSHARNEGLKYSKSEYVAFLDDDDYLLPEYIEKAIDTLDRNRKIDIVFFNVAIVTKEKVSRVVNNDFITPKEFLFGKKEIGTGSNIFFRKKIYDETSGFDERYLRYQDIEFVAKKLNIYKSIWIDSLQVVKYYNEIDNYLNYEKSLMMQKLLREDMTERGIIDKKEEKELMYVQLHGLYNDMLAKNMKRKDIKIVYELLKNNRQASFVDTGMYYVYSFSKTIFNVVFRLFMSKRKEDSNVDFNKLIAYRNQLEVLIK